MHATYSFSITINCCVFILIKDLIKKLYNDLYLN
jgi:hypothetical protein